MISRDNSLLADRYVPIRKATRLQHLAPNPQGDLHQPKTPYARLIEEQQRRCLSFSKHKTESTVCSELDTACSRHLGMVKEKKMDINLVKKMQAQKIIYVQDVADNYYGQCLDWSSQGVIGIGIQSDCYLYNNQIISKVSFSNRLFSNYRLTSIKFNKEGTLLFMGDSEGELNVIDLAKLVQVRSFAPHSARIGCIQNTYDWGLLTGSKDCSIAHHDLRVQQPLVMKLVAHKHEVCGLTVQNCKVASGGNDGTVLLWNISNSAQFGKHQLHRGAVKALQWCPWRANLLASGGGSNDHKIILWNPESGQAEHVLEGKSQITGLAWRQSAKDLVSTHGGNRKQSYGMIWSSKIKEFTHVLNGHKKRIVGLAISEKDQSEICTLGADETMRFWRTRRENLPNDCPKAERRLTVNVTLK